MDMAAFLVMWPASIEKIWSPIIKASHEIWLYVSNSLGGDIRKYKSEWLKIKVKQWPWLLALICICVFTKTTICTNFQFKDYNSFYKTYMYYLSIFQYKSIKSKVHPAVK